MLERSNLHKYQLACVEHAINNPFCGLFLDMGLGKTATTLTVISDLLFDYCEISSVLVIAPKRVVESVWAEEAKKWSHLANLSFSKVIGTELKRLEALKAKANVYLISRDNIAWLCALYGGGKLPFDMVVIDELSSFKSYKSLRFKALKSSQPYLKRLIGLTGTPAPNGLIDLWSQLYLMDRGERLERTISKYRERYFRPGKTNGHIVYSYHLAENSERLIHSKIDDICISMKAQDYIDMPEKIDNYIKLVMPEAIKKQYIDFEKNKVLELLEAETVATEAFDENGDVVECKVIKPISAANAAGLANKLLQFANGAVYDEDHNVCPIHDLKLDALKEIVEDSNGKPILIGWTFKFDKDRIMKHLKAYKPRELKTNKDIDDWNAGKIQVLLAHPASAGHGLNLQAGGNVIVWYGQTWSLELYQQFNARLHRQGQTERVIVHHLILEGSHDEDVIKALSSKDKKQNSLMDSIKAKIDKYISYAT